MSNNIKEIIAERDSVKFATDAGQNMHNRLGRIFIDGDKVCGDVGLVAQIKAIPGLSKLFGPKSMTEVPIAGNLGACFVSRRIDRLYIDDEKQMVCILDYKTDINHSVFHDKYVAQLREYAILMTEIYPTYKCKCFILWTHDWELESI